MKNNGIGNQWYITTGRQGHLVLYSLHVCTIGSEETPIAVAVESSAPPDRGNRQCAKQR